MSRIGSAPIEIPGGVDVKVDGSTVTIKGSKGTLTRAVRLSTIWLSASAALLSPNATCRHWVLPTLN